MKKRLNFILLNGAIGSGKSTIASLLEKRLKRTAVLEIEDIRCLLSDFKRGEVDNLLAWNVIYRMCDEYLKNDVSVMLKIGVPDQNFVNKFLRLAKKHKCVISFYHLQAPRNVLLKRMDVRKEWSIPKAQRIRSISNHENIHFSNATVIDTSEAKPSDVANYILNDMRI